MKKVKDEEFREYLEYKKFMGEVPGETGRKPLRKMSMDELDQVRAARGNQDFALFLKEIREREEDKK